MKDALIKFRAHRVLILIFAIAQGFHCIGQKPVVIDSTIIKQHLEILASDAMNGRETGTEGQKKAADYIRYNMKKNDLEALDNDGDYYQEFVLSKVKWDSVSLSIDGKKYRHLKDFAAIPQPNSSVNLNTEKVYFLGYGIDDNRYSDYRGNNVEGKSIIIKQGEPKINDKNYLITQSSSPSLWSGSLKEKLKVAHRHGVKSVFVIQDSINEITQKYESTLSNRKIFIDSISQHSTIAPYCFISKDIAGNLIKSKSSRIDKRTNRALKTKNFKAVKIKTDNISLHLKKHINHIHTENVAGLLRGKQPPEEGYIILSGHYDHLGMKDKSIFNGADDNGSGCSTILSIIDEYAMSVAKQTRPEKSILFLFMTGEEKGLLGSRYYVENPLLPLEYAHADINIDMIGRIDEHHDTTDYIYVIGADKISKEFDELIRHVNDTTSQLKLDYRYNDDNDPNRFYYRSDHYNFALKGIPVVFFFSGVHEDYHMSTDTEEKILYQGLTDRARFIYYVTNACANRGKPFTKNEKP